MSNNFINNEPNGVNKNSVIFMPFNSKKHKNVSNQRAQDPGATVPVKIPVIIQPIIQPATSYVDPMQQAQIQRMQMNNMYMNQYNNPYMNNPMMMNNPYMNNQMLNNPYQNNLDDEVEYLDIEPEPILNNYNQNNRMIPNNANNVAMVRRPNINNIPNQRPNVPSNVPVRQNSNGVAINRGRSRYFNRPDFIKFENVRKEYKADATSAATVALDNASFSIKEGELVIFLGMSGAGKSTALNMLGGMDSVTSGKVIVGNKEITKYDFDELTDYRRKDIGFIFQFYNLVQTLTARENIELSTDLSNDSMDADVVLASVGLAGKEDKFPCQLSGGEQQRIAIARAVAKKPKILLCDEPTGALDYKTGKLVLKLLQDICKKDKITTIIITHNSAIAPMADRVIKFNSGKITDIIENSNPSNVGDIEW